MVGFSSLLEKLWGPKEFLVCAVVVYLFVCAHLTWRQLIMSPLSVNTAMMIKRLPVLNSL